jgi:hypothetical protein
MREEFERVYEQLWAWCRARDFAGHDPFDALNSRLFRATPLVGRSRLARLVWTQALKRSPINLRRLALVPPERNPKGTALFALAALARLRTVGDAESEHEARALLDDLLRDALNCEGRAAWGYNFDWQGRAFYAPRGTPTVVPTAFAVRALVQAHETFNARGPATAHDADEGRARGRYVAAARSACDFILHGLNPSAGEEDEVCFSYTPLDRTRVFNASLLAGEALASTGALTGEEELLRMALRAARYVVRRQRADGSWAYGEAAFQSWADNFHTAFVLTSLARIRRAAADDDEEIANAIERGYRFWREGFFLADGWPKYYHRSAHPADAHSAGAAVVALAELKDDYADALELAERVSAWAVRHLFDERGFFYYQRRRRHTVRTPYMRWSQGWMAYALARLIEGKRQK